MVTARPAAARRAGPSGTPRTPTSPCGQIMHVGDYRKDAQALARKLHDEFLPKHDLRPAGHHREIYLSDPNRVAPEKMRTVVRQPVR